MRDTVRRTRALRSKRASITVLAASVAMGVSLLSAPAALASGGPGPGSGHGGGDGGGGGGRRLGPAVSTDGVGSLGSTWTLKSQHDDDGPGLVAGEEFEIATPAGHVWTVTFADNDIVFLDHVDVTATATGLRTLGKAPDQGIDQTMSVHAVDRATGEVIDGSVDLPAN
ncbi:hypothetical protein MXD59_14710 [Frankia sp. Ag45/Mut15]|uniref:DUF5666 domain-containing protein n=1 Tax=Frankia umida TaxID=573489 RepID=A0ABT0K182_9ACTN|nr:hypothetical protein [Frankia umida]MCK9877008.1 hypothetical protein [Frankia umida]